MFSGLGSGVWGIGFRVWGEGLGAPWPDSALFVPGRVTWNRGGGAEFIKGSLNPKPYLGFEVQAFLTGQGLERA